MTTVQIESGICGFCTVVRVLKHHRNSIEVSVKSDCRQVMDLGQQLQKLDMRDILKNPINDNPIYHMAGKCNLHPSCPVPCGVIKAAEVELGLALKKDVKILFQDHIEEVNHAE